MHCAEVARSAGAHGRDRTRFCVAPRCIANLVWPRTHPVYGCRMSSALKPPDRMTVAEFLAWDAPGQTRWELADGEPIAMAPASRTHGALQLEAGRLIGNHLADAGSRCSVVAAPGIVPRVRASENFRIPDLAVTCTRYDTEEYDVSDPVLIIEILHLPTVRTPGGTFGRSRRSRACGRFCCSAARRFGLRCCIGEATEVGRRQRRWSKMAIWFSTVSISPSSWRRYTGPRVSHGDEMRGLSVRIFRRSRHFGGELGLEGPAGACPVAIQLFPIVSFGNASPLKTPGSARCRNS